MAEFKLFLIFYTGSFFTNLLLLISFALLSLFLFLSYSISFYLSAFLCAYVDLTHAVSSVCFLSTHSFSRPHCLLFVPLPTLFYLFSSNIVVCFLSQSLPLSHFYPFSHSQSLSLSIAHFRFHLVFLLFLIFLLRMSWLAIFIIRIWIAHSGQDFVALLENSQVALLAFLCSIKCGPASSSANTKRSNSRFKSRIGRMYFERNISASHRPKSA